MAHTPHIDPLLNLTEEYLLASHSSDTNQIVHTLKQLQRSHFERAAEKIREDMERSIAQKHIAKNMHKTEWRVGIDELWYNTRMLLVNAYGAAGMTENHNLSGPKYDCYLQHLRLLGFQVARGCTPIQSHAKKLSAIDRLRAAAALICLTGDAACTEKPESDTDPLQILLDGNVYPAGALLGLAPGSAPSDQDLATIKEAGAVLCAARDPLDRELEALVERGDLSTEARHEIAARIGQGKFRSALIRLYGGCSVTGVTTTEVLRAAHIHRWVDCTKPIERLDPNNGLLLTANLDALFEVGLIAFNDEGCILISPRLDADAQAALGIHSGMSLVATPTAAQRVYLAKHRERTCGMRDANTASTLN
ncbi:HNH endonuclease [Vogesella indigofera]|uniref:HNH endonuclease n=1 Tax=Vogesella indigofera TaxID=45465 RepID=UPI00234DA8A3|nr:HNH endonuclease [Vogesella indigofera]MDC7704695.1 HNH endonuclease [Vogesella indigofera]